jgi:hypothetical protein
MLSAISDAPDSNCIAKIYVDAFKILISFLQLFRLRTREFVVKPTEICGPLSLYEEYKGSGRGCQIIYNPQGIEKIDVNCEPECHVGANLIKNTLRHFVIPETHFGDIVQCNELQLHEIGQELRTLRQDASYRFDPTEMLVNELLTEANRLLGSGRFPPYPEDPFNKFQYPSPGLCAAILNIAIACEIYVKEYVRKNGRTVYKNILEHHRDFTVPVLGYLDYVIKDIDGISLKEKCRELWSNIELLFELRNRIVHSGKATIAANSGIRHEVSPRDVSALGRSVSKMIEWLKSQNKCSFTFDDVPKLRTQITSKQLPV